MKNDSGQALIEVAFSISLLLLMVMATMDFSYMTLAKSTLQNAVRQSGRYAITGNCITTGGSCSQSRYNSIIQTLEDSSVGFLTSSNVGSYVTITCTNKGGGCPNNAGGPGDIITISVNYPVQIHNAAGLTLLSQQDVSNQS